MDKKEKKGERIMKFIMGFFFLVCIAFLGVLGGLQVANSGMKEMRGYEDPKLQEVVAMKTNADGNVEAEVLGQKVNITEKEKQLQEMKSFNIFSKAGEGLTKAVEKTVQLTIEPALTKIQHVISGES
jgi:hypothetical protein